MLSFRDPDLAKQLVRHGDDGHSLGTESGFGSNQIVEKPDRIVQPIRMNHKLAICFYSDARYIAEGPESHSRDVMIASPAQSPAVRRKTPNTYCTG